MHVMLVVIPNSLEAQRAKCVSGGALKSPGLWSMMSAGAVGGQPPWPMPLSMLRLCVRHVVGSRTVSALTQGGRDTTTTDAATLGAWPSRRLSCLSSSHRPHHRHRLGVGAHFNSKRLRSHTRCVVPQRLRGEAPGIWHASWAFRRRRWPKQQTSLASGRYAHGISRRWRAETAIVIMARWSGHTLGTRRTGLTGMSL